MAECLYRPRLFHEDPSISPQKQSRRLWNAMLSNESLGIFAPRMINPEVHAAALEAARQDSTVNTPLRLSFFMGQIFVETDGLTRMEENLNYKTPEILGKTFSAVRDINDARSLIARGPAAIANRVYANRLGNGSEESGDGWRYRGSGYKQLTGRSNYRNIGKIIDINLEGSPHLAREPFTAALAAFAFWDLHECSVLADAEDLEGITLKINGRAMLGLKERRAATLKALSIWRI